MHISVLLNECLDNLNIKEDSIIVDATLGYGGHSSNILKILKKGFLYSFDQDKEAILFARERLNKISDNFEIINSNFVNMKDELNKRKIIANGILFDLGVSSPQLDDGTRGFSFHKDAKLDMRMNQDDKISAYEVVNEYSVNDLIRIFYSYGEEKYAKSIAFAIDKYRIDKKIETTLELVDIISSSVPEKYKRTHHPARKVFQSIRIEVNNELNVLKKALIDSLDLIEVGGRVCVITFHSLEDKIVKDIFKSSSSVDPMFKSLPIIPLEYQPSFKVLKAIDPSKEEIENNKRSRSAKLRIIERVR